MRVQTDFSGILRWLSNEGLEVVLLVLGAALLTRVIGKIARMWTGRIDAKNADKELWSEESKHLHSLIQVLSYVAVAVLYVLFGIQILLRFGVNLVALVAPATVLGAALGFGAQKIVQDFLDEGPEAEKIRIRPDSKEDDVALPPEDEDNGPLPGEELFTEKLAMMYASQERYSEAMTILKTLNLKYPEKSGYFAERIGQLEQRRKGLVAD